ncbi:MAG: YbaB/EbfC family nucleoid-associated protein [Treponema sp.]|nr:YbaB/EbfC family nucleoid-associated protein [Treponema sp.]
MNPFELLKNPQAIKEQADKFQRELAETTATGSSGGKMVSVTLNGKFELLGVKIDPVCIDPSDPKMLEDLIVAAHHDATSKIQDLLKDKTSSMMGGLNLSGFGL